MLRAEGALLLDVRIVADPPGAALHLVLTAQVLLALGPQGLLADRALRAVLVQDVEVPSGCLHLFEQVRGGLAKVPDPAVGLLGLAASFPNGLRQLGQFLFVEGQKAKPFLDAWQALHLRLELARYPVA